MTRNPEAPAGQRQPHRSVGQSVTAILSAVNQIPITLLVVTALIVVGVVTGTLFTQIDPTDSAIASLKFGLPAFREGRIWTVFTGAVTFTAPEFYYFVGTMLAVGLGLYERRVGSLRAAFALLVTHSVGVVIPALLLWPFANSGWTWASNLAGNLDAGLSAGGFGVMSAATALLRHPWRNRMRVLGTSFLMVMVIKSGLLWDLEHMAAWATGLAIGPRLARPVMQKRLLAESSSDTARSQMVPTPQADVRILTASIAAAFAISNVVESFYPGLGGLLGPGVGLPEVRGFWLIMLELAISMLIAAALPQPRGLVWWVGVTGALAIALNSLINTPRLPRIGDAVCALILLVVLIWNRNAWSWRKDREALRPIALLLIMTAVFTTLTSVSIWAVRGQFSPSPGAIEILRQAVSRLTFTSGPLAPISETAHRVIAITGIVWALILTCWLVWALYLSDGGWRSVRDTLRSRDTPSVR